jgi:hypothetical protein
VAGHAVLGAGQPSLGAGAPRLVVLADGWVAVLRDVATPPASHAGLIGHRVTALGGDAACRATLGALALMWLVRPHGATVARWDNLDGSGRAWTQAERAREAMSLAGAPLLVAALDGCAGRAWVDLDGRSPALTRLDAAPRTVGNWTAAIMSSHMGPVFQHDPQRPWAQEFAPSVYVDAAGAPRWLLGTLAAGEPCQDRVEVTVVWRQQDSHRAVQAAPDAGSLTDIDGDDVPELLTEAAIYRWSKDGAWTSIVTLPRRDLDAPC